MSSNISIENNEVYLKVHQTTGGALYAFASPENIGKVYYKNKIKVKVSVDFYKGELVSIDYGLNIIKKHYNTNIIGKLAEIAVKKKLIHPKAILWLKDKENNEKVAHTILMSL